MKIIVAVRDIRVDAFMPLWTAPTAAAAIRAFHDESNREDQNNPIWKHPEDYELYQLGTWNEETGELQNDKKRLAIAADTQIPPFVKHQVGVKGA